ncbi:MAG: tetratricopeptide repeat protein [Planctomycetota bacterium]|nr:tetratricopeptide repeat protein [Planctomycetota bacterium]
MSKWIRDVDAKSFREEVVERSKTVPVVVDFWAEWCGPCKTLTPQLEKHAREGNGRFLLAKVDIDKNAEIAQAFQVQAVPTVIGLRGGKMVDGFQGALPEKELAAFLDNLAPGKGPREVERAQELAAGGDREEAIKILRAWLRENTGDVQARIMLASILVDDGKPIDAKKVSQKLDEEALATDEGKALKAKLEYAEDAGDVDALRSEVESDPNDPKRRIDLGKALVAEQRHEEGLEQLLEAVEIDPKYDGDAARKAMLNVFDMLGPENELAASYRYKLSLVLFS